MTSVLPEVKEKHSSNSNIDTPFFISSNELPTITQRKFILNLDTGEEQLLFVSKINSNSKKKRKVQIHFSDKEFVTEVRQAFENYLKTTDKNPLHIVVALQFRVIDAQGTVRMVHQVMQLLDQNHISVTKQVSVSETDYSCISKMPLRQACVFVKNNDKIEFLENLNIPKFAYSGTKCPYSNRQLQILNLLSQGHSTSEIANTLFISADTVRTHRQHILQRSQQANMTATVANCLRRGWI